MTSDETRTSQELSPSELRTLGRELGTRGLVDFLLQGQERKGDYTAERDSRLPQGSVAELIEQMEQMRLTREGLELRTEDRTPELPG